MSEISSFYMYTADMPSMQRGRVEKQLGKQIRYNGKVMPYTDFVAMLLLKGYRPRSSECLTRNGGTVTEYAMMDNHAGYTLPTKTLYAFALYLVERDAVTAEAQRVLREQEAAHYAELERMKREEQARIEAEARQKAASHQAFKDWIHMQVDECQHDPRLIILQDIFEKLHGGGRSAYLAELLVLFDNLDDQRVRVRLCESLHPDNKASRMCFTAVTGIKLPKGAKASREIVLALGEEKKEAG